MMNNRMLFRMWIELPGNPCYVDILGTKTVWVTVKSENNILEARKKYTQKPYDIGQAPTIVTSFTRSSLELWWCMTLWGWGKLPQSMEMAIKGFIAHAHAYVHVHVSKTCLKIGVNIYGMKIKWPVIRGVWKHWRYIANAAAQIVSLESQQPYPNHSRKLHFHYNSLSVCLTTLSL